MSTWPESEREGNQRALTAAKTMVADAVELGKKSNSPQTARLSAKFSELLATEEINVGLDFGLQKGDLSVTIGWSSDAPPHIGIRLKPKLHWERLISLLMEGLILLMSYLLTLCTYALCNTGHSKPNLINHLAHQGHSTQRVSDS